MKMKVLLLALFSVSAFAASDLVKEFTRRRKVVQSRQVREIYAFLRKHQKNPEDIRELELLNDQGKYALKFANDDVCFGDTATMSLNCYNAVGYQTFFEAGDLD